jgi:glycosyltransferase involved in cell wall biosynthesis
MGEGASITIAIPTHNRCEAVTAVVTALLPQLQAGDELFVVDDGSDDGTAHSLNTISEVRLIRNETNQGMTSAWNSCLGLGSCDWICIIHDDDIVAPTALGAVRQACAVAGTPSLVGHRCVSPAIDSSLRCRVVEPGAWAVLNTLLVPSGVTVHRMIISALGRFSERFPYSPDIEYFARICRQYRSVVIENPPVIHCRLHQDNYQFSTWRRRDFLQQLEEIESLVTQYSGLSGAAASEAFRRRMNAHCAHMLRWSGHSGQAGLCRTVARAMRGRPYLRRRIRLAALVAALLNWYPPLL